jgi:hypothetical protein
MSADHYEFIPNYLSTGMSLNEHPNSFLYFLPWLILVHRDLIAMTSLEGADPLPPSQAYAAQNLSQAYAAPKTQLKTSCLTGNTNSPPVS